MTDPGAGGHGMRGSVDPNPSGIRVLPAHVAEEAIKASGARPRGERPPKMFRPERLAHLEDLVPLVRAGEPVILHVDRLDEHDQARALDVAAGIAVALDATMAKLESTPGVSIVPRRGQPLVESPADTGSNTNGEPVPTAIPRDARPAAALCVFCELRSVPTDHDPPLDVVVMRDGSRARAPRIRLCTQCQRSVRNWRFTVAWCSTCERWGRRGVKSSCGLPYGS